MSQDFKKLDVERAKISVAVQEARDLVTKWLDADFNENDESGPAVVTQLSSTAGLGYKQDKPQAPQGKALAKLQKAFKHQKPVPSKEGKSSKNSYSNDQSSKVTVAHGKQTKEDSDSDSEPESRTTSVRKKRIGISALDAYKQGKNKKRKH